MKPVRIHIRSLPVYTPAGHPVYLSGNVNGWKKRDEHFRFLSKEDGTLLLEFETEETDLQFRINRGDWTLAEGDENAGETGIRHYALKEEQIDIVISIASWIDFKDEHFQHSASPNVRVIKHDFFIPQLNRRRRVSCYLPPDYYSSTNHYPVLYAADGQNAFDSYNTLSGEWNMDESMDAFYMESGHTLIIIAIDNGEEKRIDEYSAWVNEEEGGGEGGYFTEFIVHTLKPFVDKHFRTKTGRMHTGIMGSSMGGLLALYASLQYPHVFGKAAVFSPSLWFTEKALALVKRKKNNRQRFYLLAGKKESEQMENDLLQVYFDLLSNGNEEKNLYLDLDKEGHHNEVFWGNYFKKAVEWLFFNDTDAIENPGSPIQIIYSPATGNLEIRTDHRLSAAEVQIQIPGKDKPLKRALFYCTNYIHLEEGTDEASLQVINKGKTLFTEYITTRENISLTA